MMSIALQFSLPHPPYWSQSHWRLLRRPIVGLMMVCTGWIALPAAGQAQIRPDATLPQPSIVTTDGTREEITGGTRSGNYLFHSFREFSVPTQGTAFFNNAIDIETIFARITGSSASTIDGLIRANGSANLFLLNPNGILFGPNAQLDIGGSFLASTADRLRFADGFEFSTDDTQTPLLTISTPIGLQFGATPQPITVQGTGNHLIYRIEPEVEVIRDQRPVGLQVRSGQTLALVGSDVRLVGGNLTAAGGRVELGGIGANSTVRLTALETGWQLGYANTDRVGTIRLSEAASVDVSGDRAGSIQIQGQRLAVLGGSTLIANTLGAGDPGRLTIRTERTRFQGVSLDPGSGAPLFPSSIFAEVGLGATGQGSTVQLETQRLRVTDGASISVNTQGIGRSGDLRIQADSVVIAGSAPNVGSSGLVVDVIHPQATGEGGNLTITADRLTVRDGAVIAAETFGSGDAGTIRLQTRQLTLTGSSANGTSAIISQVGEGASGNAGQIILEAEQIRLIAGGEIAASTFGSGNAGTLVLRADQIDLIEAPGESTGIFTSVLPNATGQGGQITLAADRLRVLNGAVISGSTFGEGSAGNVEIRAQEIELAGFNDSSRSGIFASAIFGTGDGGDLSIWADRLTIRDGATISVSNFSSRNPDIPPGQGAAGNITLTADQVQLDRGGTITASTNVGTGGNVRVISSLVTLNRQSAITTNSGGQEPGGNLEISSQVLVARGNSDITANAVNARGGRVTITADAILGATYRPRPTGLSDITASSELGADFNGVVELNTPDTDPARGTIELPESVLATDAPVATACTQVSTNEFLITGRGGLPQSPIEPLSGQPVWQDVRLPEAIAPEADWETNLETDRAAASRTEVDRRAPELSASADAWEATAPSEAQSAIVEAQGWIVDAEGNVQLIAAPSYPSEPASWVASGQCGSASHP